MWNAGGTTADAVCAAVLEYDVATLEHGLNTVVRLVRVDVVEHFRGTTNGFRTESKSA